MESLRDIHIYEGGEFFLLTGRARDHLKFKVVEIMKNIPKFTISERNMSDTDLHVYLGSFKEEKSLRLVCVAQALLGLSKFLMGYYLFIVTQKTKIGNVRGHSLYKAEELQLLKLFSEKESRDEKKYRQIFESIDFTSGFYFSYSYDLTSTLQENVTFLLSKTFGKSVTNSRVTRSMTALGALDTEQPLDQRDYYPWKTMYVWNHTQLLEVFGMFQDKSWVTPVVHGYIGYKRLSMLGRQFDMLVIARRSRYFAGTRYLKRGVNEEGKVANDVETEQILVDRSHPKGAFSSYVQIRGSIPLFWCQDSNSVLPQPPIICKKKTVNQVDLFAEATRKHFGDLFQRYGEPITVLSLLKLNEKNPRESHIGDEFRNTVEFLSTPMPPDYQIRFEVFDMKSELKTMDACISKLRDLAKNILSSTGLFCCTREIEDDLHISYQIGVVRTNCIDCIDRTNAAQQAIAHVVLECQLAMMGLVECVSKTSRIVGLLTTLFEEMGDELARQYAGSAAHQNLRKHSGPSKIFTSLKRHWSNMITDTGKQQAINLFLGIYKPLSHSIPLWDIQDDSILHMIPISYTPPPKDWWKVFSLRFKRKLGLADDFPMSEGRRKGFRHLSSISSQVILPADLNKKPIPRLLKTGFKFIPLLTLPPSNAITSFDRKLGGETSVVVNIQLDAEKSELNEPVTEQNRAPQDRLRTEFLVSQEETAAFQEYLHPEKQIKSEQMSVDFNLQNEAYEIDAQILLDQAEQPEAFQRILTTEVSGEMLLSPLPGIKPSLDSMYQEEHSGVKTVTVIEEHFASPVRHFKEKNRGA